jgi:hypothetical protein
MMVCDGESSLKEKLKLLDSHKSKLDSFTTRINEHHKEAIAFGKRVRRRQQMTLRPTNLLPLLDVPDGKIRTRKLRPRKKGHLNPVKTDHYTLSPHQPIPFYSLECMFTKI